MKTSQRVYCLEDMSAFYYQFHFGKKKGEKSLLKLITDENSYYWQRAKGTHTSVFLTFWHLRPDAHFQCSLCVNGWIQAALNGLEAQYTV